MFSQNAYVKGTMTKDEEIKVEAKYHWIKWLWFYFMFATLGVVALVSFSLAFTSYLDKQTDMAAALLIMACVLGVYPFLLYLSLHLTEMVCTNRRVVYKPASFRSKRKKSRWNGSNPSRSNKPFGDGCLVTAIFFFPEPAAQRWNFLTWTIRCRLKRGSRRR